MTSYMDAIAADAAEYNRTNRVWNTFFLIGLAVLTSVYAWFLAPSSMTPAASISPIGHALLVLVAFTPCVLFLMAMLMKEDYIAKKFNAANYDQNTGLEVAGFTVLGVASIFLMNVASQLIAGVRFGFTDFYWEMNSLFGLILGGSIAVVLFAAAGGCFFVRHRRIKQQLRKA